MRDWDDCLSQLMTWYSTVNCLHQSNVHFENSIDQVALFLVWIWGLYSGENLLIRIMDHLMPWFPRVWLFMVLHWLRIYNSPIFLQGSQNFLLSRQKSHRSLKPPLGIMISVSTKAIYSWVLWLCFAIVCKACCSLGSLQFIRWGCYSRKHSSQQYLI